MECLVFFFLVDKKSGMIQFTVIVDSMMMMIRETLVGRKRKLEWVRWSKLYRLVIMFIRWRPKGI